MPDVTQSLNAAHAGQADVLNQLFPLVYDELRQLAARQLAQEKPGQTLQPTALVHEAWLRLIPSSGLITQHSGLGFEHRRYFFAAAAEAMRRILVERARRMKLPRAAITPEELLQPEKLRLEAALSVHEALDQLQAEDAEVAQVVRLRFFAGLSMPAIAETLDLPLRTVERWWTYARSWLYQRLNDVE